MYEPWMPVFPPRIRKTLRYSTTCSLTATSGAVATPQIFRANDLFDPDFSGTGHQPMGFDQLMVWYNHFCVVRSKIICTFRCTTATSPTVCLRVDGASSALSVIDRIVEFGGCMTDTISRVGVYGSNKTMSMEVDMPKIQGVSISAVTADPTLRGDAATSPTEVTYFHLTMWDTTAATGSCEVDVVLEQDAYFMEARDATESLLRQARLGRK